MIDFNAPVQEAAPPKLDWIIVAIDRHGDGWVMDADEDFYGFELVTEFAATDCGIVVPKDLAVGLYKVTNTRVFGDFDGTEISGTWESLVSVVQGLTELPDDEQEIIWDEGSEAAHSATYPPKPSEWVGPYPEGSLESKAWQNGFRHTYQRENH